MRVAFFTGPFPALSETFILRQISFLRQAGHEIHVFPQEAGSYRPTHSTLLGADFASFVHYPPALPKKPILRIGQCLKLVVANATFLKPPWSRVFDITTYGSYASNLRLFFWSFPLTRVPHEFDAIISHFETPANRVAMLRHASILQGPHLAFFHTSVFFHNPLESKAIARDIGYLQKFVFPTASRMLPIHSKLGKILIDAGADSSRLEVFHMGCGESVPRVEREGAAPLRFLSSCRLVGKKGLDDALRALAEADSKLPDWRYDILGDGPQRDGLESLATSLSIADKVAFHGSVDEATVRNFLSSADIFLAPSKTDASGDREGLPVAILEASAAGVPVISTSHEGIPEGVENRVSGILVHEGDIHALADAITSLSANPALRSKMGLCGVQKIRREFDQKSLNLSLERLIREVA